MPGPKKEKYSDLCHNLGVENRVLHGFCYANQQLHQSSPEPACYLQLSPGEIQMVAFFTCTLEHVETCFQIIFNCSLFGKTRHLLYCCKISSLLSAMLIKSSPVDHREDVSSGGGSRPRHLLQGTSMLQMKFFKKVKRVQFYCKRKDKDFVRFVQVAPEILQSCQTQNVTSE